MPHPEMAEEKAPAPKGPPAPGGGPEAAIQKIQSGFQELQEMMAGAQGALSPEDMQAFEAAVQATDAFVQQISAPMQEQGPPAAPPPGPGGPMAGHANAGAKPAEF